MAAVAGLMVIVVPVWGQEAPAQSEPAALRWVRDAVNAQIYSDSHDIPWMYRDHDVQPGTDVVKLDVDTPKGGVRRTIELNGKPLSAAAEEAETERIYAFVSNPSAQAKKRHDERKDDKQSTNLLRAWPQAFIVAIGHEDKEFVTLNYWPNPRYNPPNIEAHVMGQMQGQIVIEKDGSQIYSVHGVLTHDVSAMFGIVKLKAGGKFSVERREVEPGHWQLVEQHTHIAGHALLFKSISEQEDEWKTEFKPSPAKTLAEAARILDAGR